MSEIVLFHDHQHDEWRVEDLDDDADSAWAYTVFGGWEAERRARKYADWIRSRLVQPSWPATEPGRLRQS
jgi:hypothetical protein